MDNRNNIHWIDDCELQVIRRFIKKRFIENAFKDFFFLFFNFDIEKRRGVTRPVIDENATSGKRWTRFETDRFGCKWKRIIRETRAVDPVHRAPKYTRYIRKWASNFLMLIQRRPPFGMEFLFEMRFIRFTCTRNEDAQARIIFLLKIESRIPRLAKCSSMHPRYTRNTDRYDSNKETTIVTNHALWTTVALKRKKKKRVLKKCFQESLYIFVGMNMF